MAEKGKLECKCGWGEQVLLLKCGAREKVSFFGRICFLVEYAFSNCSSACSALLV